VPLTGIVLSGIVDAATSFLAFHFELQQSLAAWKLGDFAQVLAGRRVASIDASPVHNRLRLCGIVKRVDEQLVLRNGVYRELFGPRFAEVAGFRQFARQVADRGLKVAVGTAGDIHNVHFALSHLQMDVQPLAIVRGDEGLPGKPEPAIFLEAARRIDVPPQHCIVFEDAPFGIEAARRAGMRAVAVCSTHSPAQLAGPHVLAAVRDYTELMNTDFLESIHVATV
jgi:beta-phosphoglucomutase-like phosphatase (HAD superfamily)